MPDAEAELRQFSYAPTPAREEIDSMIVAVVGRLLGRADEHRGRGFPEREAKIRHHALAIQSRLDLIHFDWQDFDREDAAAGKEPY